MIWYILFLIRRQWKRFTNPYQRIYEDFMEANPDNILFPHVKLGWFWKKECDCMRCVNTPRKI